NVLWQQPESSHIFASFRDDVPASSTLFAPATSGNKTSVADGLSAGGQRLESPSSTAKSTRTATPSAKPTPSGSTAAGPTPTASPSAKPVTIQARMANQSMCAG